MAGAGELRHAVDLPPEWGEPTDGVKANLAAQWGLVATSGYDPLVLSSYRAYLGEARQDVGRLEEAGARYLVRPWADGMTGLPEGARHLLRARLLWEDLVLYEHPTQPERVHWEGEGEAALHLERVGATRWEARAQAALAGTLVVAQPYYPGWRAWVDGAEVPVLRLKGVWQGVPLEPGAHVVRLEYRPRWLAPALVASLLGVTGVLGSVARPGSPRLRGARSTLRWWGPGLAPVAAAGLLAWNLRLGGDPPVELLYSPPEAEVTFREPGLEDVTLYARPFLASVGGDLRPSIFQHPDSRIRYRLTLPRMAQLRLAYGIDETTWAATHGAGLRVLLEHGGEEHVLLDTERPARPGGGPAMAGGEGRRAAHGRECS